MSRGVKKSLSKKRGAIVKLVALEIDLRRELNRQFGGLPISSGNCYGALILNIGDRVNYWLARATQRDIIYKQV